MPIFTPGRRWQPPFYPFKREPFGHRLLARIERAVKGPLFGCRMCGNCLLQETALICPMECPKGARNGPCGGSTGTLLRRSDAPVHLVSHLRAIVQIWTRGQAARSAAAARLE